VAGLLGILIDSYGEENTLFCIVELYAVIFRNVTPAFVETVYMLKLAVVCSCL